MLLVVVVFVKYPSNELTPYLQGFASLGKLSERRFVKYPSNGLGVVYLPVTVNLSRKGKHLPLVPSKERILQAFLRSRCQKGKSCHRSRLL